ncbi:3-(3-hydroxy-phenyl)propionate/3-hydroxycinnamic acid hydroxylase [Nocardia otitidiscaviarum]|uniref:3-(3-hydroxy-phenyl)propionate/3-hydroxycinnamic acid hydroxylase n=1 Tax=Nocardia otitidiscaviarum TaxID=1823 RepID=A0A378YS35_9NOCA|nr:3-(3-hydroxy-phenyl)propionate/3-hydroxycinnamic acid hydroxylase [Nocardia otitidiscaviarum]
MRVVETDVIIVGAGPTGLMLANESRLAGVRALVLEKYPQPRETPKASGIGGRILDLLRYRGLLERLEAAGGSYPPPRFPFGGVYLDLTQLADPPMRALAIPQLAIEQVLGQRAEELGAEIRRGHTVVGVGQDDDTVTADVHGPDGPYQVTAHYLVGCDGGRSPIRGMAGIEFSGTTLIEVNRLAQVTTPEMLTVHDNGDLDVPGVGRIAAGYTRTEHGQFAIHATPEILFLQTSEDEGADYDSDEPLTLPEVRESIRRVLGVDLPLGDPMRLSRYVFQDRQAERYRAGRILVAGDAAHLFPATGTALNAGMSDAVNLAWKLAAAIEGWAPEGLLDTYHDERHFAGARARLQTRAQMALRRGGDPAADALRTVFEELLTDEATQRRLGALVGGTDIRYPLPGSDQHALAGTFAADRTLRTDVGVTSIAELMRAARPVFLDLADRADLRAIVREWLPRVEVVTAETEDRPADALLIRPDAHIAWAAGDEESADSAAPTLRAALARWFGSETSRTGSQSADTPSATMLHR